MSFACVQSFFWQQSFASLGWRLWPSDSPPGFFGPSLTVLPSGLTGQQTIGHSTLVVSLLVLSKVVHRWIGWCLVKSPFGSSRCLCLLVDLAWLAREHVNRFCRSVGSVFCFDIVLTVPVICLVRLVFRRSFLSRMLGLFLAWVRLVFWLPLTAQVLGNHFSCDCQFCHRGSSLSLLLFSWPRLFWGHPGSWPYFCSVPEQTDHLPWIASLSFGWSGQWVVCSSRVLVGRPVVWTSAFCPLLRFAVFPPCFDIPRRVFQSQQRFVRQDVCFRHSVP